MSACFTGRSGEEASSLSSSITPDDSAVRPAVHRCPAGVDLVDRVAGARDLRFDANRRDRAVPGAMAGICSTSHGAAIRSTQSTAPVYQATLRLEQLSASGVDDESAGHRRHPVVVPTRSLTMYATTQPAACRCGAAPSNHDGATPWKSLLRILANVFTGRRIPSIEEQYLAQAVDAQDFQVRLFALERARP